MKKIEAGPSFVKTTILSNFIYNPKPCSWLGCGPNYTWDEITNHSVGLSLIAKLELAVSVPFGFEIGLISNLNKYRYYFGADFLIDLGYMRERNRE